MGTNFKNRDIVAIDDFSRDDLVHIIEKAEEMRKREEIWERNSQELAGKKLFYMFYEPSTRTCTSFKTAMSELGGIHDGFSGTEATSVKKNESLFMTLKMAEANHADVIVLRHPKDGSAQWAADAAEVPVINGGDGRNEHPTQTLLDLVTINQIVPGINRANIGFGGDLKYGRTAHSLPIGLSKFENITLHLAAPHELAMPSSLIKMLGLRNMTIVEHTSVEEAIKESQIFYMTRPQTERMKEYGLSEKEIYDALEPYRLTLTKLQANPDIKLMHPLPIDSRLAEIEFVVVTTDHQYYLQQAENGIFLRKALLIEILEGTESRKFNSKVSVCEGNNLTDLTINPYSPKEREFIDSIKKGVVIDHIEAGKAQKITQTLELGKKGYTVVIGYNMSSPKRGRKDVIKLVGGEINGRMIKTIEMLSPNATFSVIENEKVARKFKAIICENPNCITRDIYEDVPSIFETDTKTDVPVNSHSTAQTERIHKLRCRYCRTYYREMHSGNR